MFAASNRFGPWDLWQVRADGRGVPLRMGVGPGTILRLSSAGDLLAFEQVSRRTNLVRVSAASGEAAVTSGNQEDLQPAYSPKGTLAFIRDLGVHIQWPDAAARRLVRLDLQAPRGLRWAPDESMLAFVATNRGVARLYLIDAESGRLRELATPGLEPGKPDWSRDGQSLVFFAGDARGLRLWRLPIRAGAAPREIRGYNLGHGFPWSDVRERPEGLFVASDFERAGVFRLDGVRGPQLLTPETRVRGVVTSWTVFRGRVYYTYAEDSQTLSLYRRSAAGGPATRIADLKTSFGDDGVLDVDPRTGDVVYSKMISEEYDIGLAHLRQSGRSWPQ
jgi:hypothetical protein